VNAGDLTPGRVRTALVGLRADGGASADDAYARAVWTVLAEPGDGVAGTLRDHLGAGPALRALLAGENPAAPGLTAAALQEARARWMPRADRALVDQAFGRARRAGARLVVPGDDGWPERLDDLGVHAPPALWVRGSTLRLDDSPAVAIVGARAATGYGEHVAAELAAGAAGDGASVVSGAAYGIDGAAHRAALAAGGRTIAVLAGGVDRPYPAGHDRLLGQIAASPGAVIAETPCGSAPTKWRFLARNRLIAALSDATVVVEAGVRSGSLNTAAHAAALGRPLGAVPGPVTSPASAGCHRILREFDGTCVTGPEDLRELLGGAPVAAPMLGGRTDDLTRLVDALSVRVPRDTVEIARGSGLAPSEVEALLGLAALEGLAVRDERGWRRHAR
jgi:DNA processing protein